MLDVRNDKWRRRPEPGTYRVVSLSKTVRLVKYSCKKCRAVASLAKEVINTHGQVRNFVCNRCQHNADLKLRGWYIMEYEYKDWANGPGIPGTWWKDGRDRLWICCPKCKRIGILTETHTVDEQGNVTPSVICSRKTCDFHETIKLKDYATYS
jgi:hypothetical protein